MRQTTPAGHLIQELAESAALSVMCRRGRPGEMIQRLPAEKREILKILRSEDMDNVRVFEWI